MANIAQASVLEEWKKIEEVAEFTAEDNKQYLIENKGDSVLQLCESTTKPTDARIGFTLKTYSKVLYTAKSGEYLWVKSFSNRATFNIAQA